MSASPSTTSTAINPVTFLGELCSVVFERHSDGSTCIQLFCEDGEPMCRATVFVGGFPQSPGYVLVKNWSENAGILDVLVKAGIVEDTGMSVPTGYVRANICKLLVAHK